MPSQAHPGYPITSSSESDKFGDSGDPRFDSRRQWVPNSDFPDGRPFVESPAPAPAPASVPVPIPSPGLENPYDSQPSYYNSEFPQYRPYNGYQSDQPAYYQEEDQDYYNPREFGYSEDPEQDIEAYPLNSYRQFDLPSQQQFLGQQHALNMSGGLSDDLSADSLEYDDDFNPFPVKGDMRGDSYPLNTFDGDESEETAYDSENERLGESDDLVSQLPPVPQQPFPIDDEMQEDVAPMLAATAPNVIMPPPQQSRRMKTIKKVRLYRGNLVIDCPVTRRLISQLGDISDREFLYMRYSAATCDPSIFYARDFSLRQTLYRENRNTELFICITLYNENDILLGRTLQGVFKNIQYLVGLNNKTWGRDSWKKISVCVVADGRDKINPRALALMAALGVYQEGFAKNMVNDKEVVAHIYEYTTKVRISHIDKIVHLTTEKAVPIQMIFCLKEHNQRKINSHRWFYQAFCPILRPNVTVLLDAGTMPGNDSIYHLWKAFASHPQVGGACGEIKAQLGQGWHKLLNPLVAAQNFEYKMSNILDKPLESVFGFISVLPGAFSAYRYNAVQNDLNGDGPLAKYFEGETQHERGAGIFTANMYLAEDRLLCFEVVSKRNASWLLKYVKSASAETDVPEGLAELVMQRRRWLNGSFFAAIYAQAHFVSIWRSGHSLLRKIMLNVEFFYQLVSMLFSWFAIGNYFLIFRILTNSLGDSALGFAPGKAFSVILLYVYCACIITIFVLSFGNRPKGTNIFYIIMVAFFAILMAYLIFATIYISVKSVEYAICINGGFKVSLVLNNSTFRDLVVSLLSTYALYFVSSFISLEPWHMFTSFLQYLLISPSYLNVLNVYAFCNLHDISWGTKGDNALRTDLGIAKMVTKGRLEGDFPSGYEELDVRYLEQLSLLKEPPEKEKVAPSSDDLKQDYYALFRSSVVLIWVFTNLALVVVVLSETGGKVVSDATSTSKRSLVNSNEDILSSITNSLLEPRATSDSCGSLGSSGGIGTQVYLSVVLWSVAGLAAFRFVGACTYLVGRFLGR